MLALCFSGLSGAANAITFHSETREAQAKAAKEAWGKVDLKRQIEVPRANLVNLLNQQLAVQKDFSESRRDALIQTLALSTDSQVSVALAQMEGLMDRATAFGCDEMSEKCWALDPSRRKQWNESVGRANAHREVLKPVLMRLKLLGLKVPPCSKVLATSTDESGMKGLPSSDVQIIKRSCAGLFTEETVQVGFSGKMEWIEAQRVAKIATDELAAKLSAADGLKANLADALKEVESESAKPDNLLKTSKAAAKVKKNLLLLLNAQDVFHLELLNQTKQDAVNAFLSTLTDAKDGAAPPVTSPKAAMAVVLFSQFFDEASGSLKATDEVSLVPLVLEREVARLQQEALTVDIQAQRDRVALLDQRAKVLRKKVEYFLRAEDARGSLAATTLDSNLSAALLGGVGKNNQKVKDDERQQLWLSLGSYLQADAVQAEVHSVDLKLAATDRAAALAYTESNIHAWRTLIDSHVSQLEAWSKAGIKSSEITATLQAVAAWWIAYGVNK